MIRWLRPWRGGYGAAPRCVVDDHQGGPPRRFLLPSQPLLAPVTGGQREHDPSGRDVELFRRHFYSSGKGLGVEGSKGAELADGLTIEDGDYKLVKTRLSAFFATHRDSVLKTSGIKNLVIVGVQTPNYIRQTDFDAVALDYDKVAVIIDATAAAKLEIHLYERRHGEAEEREHPWRAPMRTVKGTSRRPSARVAGVCCERHGPLRKCIASPGCQRPRRPAAPRSAT